ncbi:MAG: peptide-methionine (S)-S-oxide reductase MsrA [Bacteroidota bacterium]
MKYITPTIAGLFMGLILLSACTLTGKNGKDTMEKAPIMEEKLSAEELGKLKKAYFASGCFWCVEAIFESVIGVKEVVSGYAGGEIDNPSYRQVASGQTRHAEAVEVYYDPELVSYETLLLVFFDSHDPTTKDRQGPDRGPQYRSAIFYIGETEKNMVDAYIQKLKDEEAFDGEITTEVSPFTKFWKAEEYHQDFERKNPNQPYVRAVSIPRLNKFKAKHPELLKKEH